MKAEIFLIVDADKKYFVSDTEEGVNEAFNENDGVLPMRSIKINVVCTTPTAQEILVTVPDGESKIAVESVESKDG